jgi:hypothetical protein
MFSLENVWAVAKTHGRSLALGALPNSSIIVQRGYSPYSNQNGCKLKSFELQQRVLYQSVAIENSFYQINPFNQVSEIRNEVIGVILFKRMINVGTAYHDACTFCEILLRKSFSESLCC